MGIWKKGMLFAVGGAGYMGLELLWRGWSHGSMFLAGGSGFLLLGALNKTKLNLPLRTAVGALGITAVELAAGLVANGDHSVWDYRQLPLNFQGQICLPFTLLWYPVSLGGMLLYQTLEQKLQKPEKTI